MRFLSEALHIAWLLPAAVPLFPGDLDEGALGELPVAPAVVADLLGKPVEAQALVDRCAGPADHGSQLFLGVLFLFYESLESFRFFDGRQVLAQEVLHEGDLAVVPLHQEGGDLGKAGLPGGGAATLPGDNVEDWGCWGDRFEICPPVSTRKRIGTRTSWRMTEAVSSSRAWGSMTFRGWLGSDRRSFRLMSYSFAFFVSSHKFTLFSGLRRSPSFFARFHPINIFKNENNKYTGEKA